MIKKTTRIVNGELYEFWLDTENINRRFKGGGGRLPPPTSTPPTRYTAEASAAKADILERQKAGKGRAASKVSALGLSSIMPDLQTPMLKGKLG